VGGLSTPWSLNSGGAKDGLYRSNDDGSTWKRVEGNGIPEGPLGRIGVAVSGADSNVVFALIEAKRADSIARTTAASTGRSLPMTTASASAPGISPMSGPIRKM